MLAVMKVNAAYVPLDAAFPVERIRFIIDDAEIKRDRLDGGLRGAPRAARGPEDLPRHGASARSTRKPAEPADRALRRPPIRSATSSTPRARPAIRRASPSRMPASAISCASPPSSTAIVPGDRVYQGMTIAFDFSIEEIWVPLMAGATLVPARPGVEPDRRRARRLPARTPRHRHGLLPDLAGDDRAGPAAAAHPAGRRRSLPAESRGALVPPGPPHPEFLRPDRGDRHGDPDRADAGQAGHHRRSALDLFDRHSRSGRRQDRRARRAWRDRHCGRRPRARLHQSRRTDDEEVHPRFPATSRTIRRDASIAPATSAASTRTARSSIAAASTRRSRSAATASS